ncbi:MAG: phosphoadenosine phosphosulfate reductase family protein [Pyrobaculum sp.]|jgi:3'-phosphoadenosine 5'-phosphosulfate sulfotransferase (PAPS reductase)/FAD synthetase
MKTIHCFFSGGRDSAVVCYVAYQVTRVRGWNFRLVHIDTTIGLEETEEYVKYYAEWLGVELVVLRPDLTFEEYAAKYPYWPHIYPPRMRWCYYKLKLRPTERYLKQHYSAGDLIAMGVRGDESEPRRRRYTGVFMEKYYEGARVNAKLWLPLFYADDETIERLLTKYKIPRSPVWDVVGMSGECFCLAGATEKATARAVRTFPKLRIRLMKIDDIIHANRSRSSEESYPIFLKDKKIRLKKWLQNVCNSPTILDYLDDYRVGIRYTGKSCQGSCML